MYHVLFVICIYIPISCIAFGIKYYYYYIHNDNQIVASVSMVYWIYLLLKFIKFLNNAVIIKTKVLYRQAYVTLDRIICDIRPNNL